MHIGPHLIWAWYSSILGERSLSYKYFYDCQGLLILEEGGPFLKSDVLRFLLTSFHSLKNEEIFSFVLNCGMYSIPSVAEPNKYEQVGLGCGSGSSFLSFFFFFERCFWDDSQVEASY